MVFRFRQYLIGLIFMDWTYATSRCQAERGRQVSMANGHIGVIMSTGQIAADEESRSGVEDVQ
ncbi:MAG: hypothetical protein R3C03_15315 [Pirellulaceae bacterium]